MLVGMAAEAIFRTRSCIRPPVTMFVLLRGLESLCHQMGVVEVLKPENSQVRPPSNYYFSAEFVICFILSVVFISVSRWHLWKEAKAIRR